MFQPELDGIGAGERRELIHETLDRKHVVISAERAHRRNPKRHVRNEVMHHMGVGEGVDRDRVAVAAAFRQRQRLWRRHREGLRHVLGRQQRAGAARSHRMGVAPDLEIPVGDLAVAVERSFQLVIIAGPTVPRRVPARASIARGSAARQCARDQRSVGCGIVGAVVAVAAGAFDMDAADARRRHPQHLRDRLTVGINALRMGPDRHRTVGQLRDRAGRPDRAVRLIGPRIASPRWSSGRETDGIVALEDGGSPATAGRSARRQIVLFWQACGLPPLRRCRQRLHRLDRLKFLVARPPRGNCRREPPSRRRAFSRPRRCRNRSSSAP